MSKYIKFCESRASRIFMNCDDLLYLIHRPARGFVIPQ